MSDFIDRFTDVVAPVISFDNTVRMVEASGAWLTDAAGKRYLDFGTGISVTNCGHNHPQSLPLPMSSSTACGTAAARSATTHTSVPPSSSFQSPPSPSTCSSS